MSKRRRRPRLRDNGEPMTPELLLVHRELQYLRAAGLTRKRKPSTADRIKKGRSGGKPNRAWVAERFLKLEESRQKVASHREATETAN